MHRCYEPGRIEAGVDEAGRGCLAGPVFAAAVVWPSDEAPADPQLLGLVRDSKTLTARQRARARAFVEGTAVAWAVASASVEEIERLNILRAAHLAMRRALDMLHGESSACCRPLPTDRQVEFVLVDGDRFEPYLGSSGFVPHACFPNGDGRFMAIAAASILAKTHRDTYVALHMHPLHPQYGWDRNKCYGTAEHMRSLKHHGPCDEHRRSFAPVRACSQPCETNSAKNQASADLDDVSRTTLGQSIVQSRI